MLYHRKYFYLDNSCDVAFNQLGFYILLAVTASTITVFCIPSTCVLPLDNHRSHQRSISDYTLAALVNISMSYKTYPSHAMMAKQERIFLTD